MTGRHAYGRMVSLFLAVVLCSGRAQAQALKPFADSDQLHLSASGLHLLSANAKKELRNGATVSYAFRLSVMNSRNGDAGSTFTYHCVFSFDLWEETYKVSRLEPGYRSASRLNQTAAEQLCLESLVVPVTIVPADGAFWLSLAYQMEDRRSPDSADTASSIAGILVDIFSRRTKDSQPVGIVEGGPFRLADLRKAR